MIVALCIHLVLKDGARHEAPLIGICRAAVHYNRISYGIVGPHLFFKLVPVFSNDRIGCVYYGSG